MKMTRYRPGRCLATVAIMAWPITYNLKAATILSMAALTVLPDKPGEDGNNGLGIAISYYQDPSSPNFSDLSMADTLKAAPIFSMAARQDDARGHRSGQERVGVPTHKVNPMDPFDLGIGAMRPDSGAKQCARQQSGQDRPMLNILASRNEK